MCQTRIQRGVSKHLRISIRDRWKLCAGAGHGSQLRDALPSTCCLRLGGDHALGRGALLFARLLLQAT